MPLSIVFISALLIVVAIVVVIIGFLLVFLGSMKNRESRIEGGGVIIIGPIPIVIGTSEKISKLLIVLAIILTVFVIALFLLTLKMIPFVIK
ncbi:MAG: DUF131 domain-containing protein [Ignisphaera sp.]